MDHQTMQLEYVKLNLAKSFGLDNLMNHQTMQIDYIKLNLAKCFG